MTANTVHRRTADSPYPPGTIVYDIVAQDVGRVAAPAAYPADYIGCDCALVIPLVGSAPAWQAEPGSLRTAAPEEIEAALSKGVGR
ncbi:hypothetical protein [Streptomyces sp. GS7]|uniref:hypothetical protein n=1 Tax=Streptomyces sp. GS7 TaxID=2692234 RepID=UPI00131955F0|nr:hypothetical protein [Streptomyces sp. GS7]QHC25647.1 hypothetical protein GR130_33930 [Streptomyces sp. GS7]